jgi:signal transduction histidine kinase
MEEAERFPRLVSLACHDLRTPLATIYGFARTLTRSGDYDDRTMRFLGMIEAAAEQMTAQLDDLGVAARIKGGRFDPLIREADTLDLARSEDARIETVGAGEQVETDAEAVQGALSALAIAAIRHGPVERVTWTVDGRSLTLAPVTDAAAPVVLGEQIRDLGALVARLVVEALDGSVAVDGGALRVVL